jgi:GNAT superfamily N-acetyltransferase
MSRATASTLDAGLHIVRSAAELIACSASCRHGLVPLTPAAFTRLAVDAHLMLLSGDRLRGHCSLWSARCGRWQGQPTGAIGTLDIEDEAAGTVLLGAAAEQLAAAGCRWAVAPLDGTTWNDYRLALSEDASRPPFLREPRYHALLHAALPRAGFSIITRYVSLVIEHLADAVADPRAAPALADWRARGGVLRALTAAELAQRLPDLFAFAQLAFADNVLAASASDAELAALYQPLLPLLRSELVLVAERCGQLAGFVFALPDHAETARGAPLRTVIIKTLAVSPSERGHGLGGALLDAAVAAGRRAGFARAVLALIHEANASLRLAQRHGAPWREYGLYGRQLG